MHFLKLLIVGIALTIVVVGLRDELHHLLDLALAKQRPSEETATIEHPEAA